MPRYKLWLLIGAILGGLSVALGAFGAHGLEDALNRTVGSGSPLTPAAVVRLLANWETAARYQMYHALVLLAVGWLASRRCGVAINLAGAALTVGTLVFSGCLYVLVLSGQKWLGMIVPVGGILLIVGWICLAVAVAMDAGTTSRTEEQEP